MGFIPMGLWLQIGGDGSVSRLDQYFEENGGKYLSDKIRSINVKRITENPGYVVGYGLKGLVKRTAADDDILVLDWGGSYLRPNRNSKWTRRFPEAIAILKQAGLLPSDWDHV